MKYVLISPNNPEVFVIGWPEHPILTPKLWPAELPIPPGWEKVELADDQPNP